MYTPISLSLRTSNSQAWEIRVSAADVREFNILPEKTTSEVKELCGTKGLDFKEVDVESMTFSVIKSSGEKSTILSLWREALLQSARPAKLFPLTFVVSFNVKADTIPACTCLTTQLLETKINMHVREFLSLPHGFDRKLKT